MNCADAVGTLDEDAPIETARPQQRLVQLGTVSGGQHNDSF